MNGAHAFAVLPIFTAIWQPGSRTCMTTLSAMHGWGVPLYVPASLLLGMGLWMLDGAFALTTHGPALHWAAVAVFICVFADLAAGILTLVTALLDRLHRGSVPPPGA